MQILHDLNEFRAARSALTGTVALVPTMGALHAGHMALVAEARRQADHVIVSIFVNPLQFGANEDLSRYPRREADDAALLADGGVMLLWQPDVATMYPEGFATTVSVAALGDTLEGACRPGHFDGVATVVAKLFNQARPDLAVFGEKDWQQLVIVRRMVADLDLGIAIIGLPTVRDADGLALSSRNAYLSHDERQRAVALPHALRAAAAALESGQSEALALPEARATLIAAGFTVDYCERWGERLLAAGRIGAARLIDNVPLIVVAER